jgi:hypothetical protein
MYLGIAGREPIGHPAQRSAVGELVLIERDDGPAVVSHRRNAAAVERLRVRQRPGERRQCSSPEERNKLAPFHSILALVPL